MARQVPVLVFQPTRQALPPPPASALPSATWNSPTMRANAITSTIEIWISFFIFFSFTRICNKSGTPHFLLPYHDGWKAFVLYVFLRIFPTRWNLAAPVHYGPFESFI